MNWRGGVSFRPSSCSELYPITAKSIPRFGQRKIRTHKGGTRVREFEFLLNGSKFFDTQSCKGGGGAIDLAMRLLGTDFRGSIAALSKTSL